MYKILLLSNKTQRQIQQLRPVEKKKLGAAFNHIEANPYFAPGGKIDRFKGDLAHLGWHYELSHGYRIHYEIYEDTKEIKIKYIGSHPEY